MVSTALNVGKQVSLRPSGLGSARDRFSRSRDPVGNTGGTPANNEESDGKDEEQRPEALRTGC